MEEQIKFRKRNKTLEVRFAEYGDIKNGGDFAWTKEKFINYSNNRTESAFMIKKIDGYQYMFLEYNKEHDIYEDTISYFNPDEAVKYFVFRKFDAAYTVIPGDTLEEIAACYEITVKGIAKVNKISDINLIMAGEILNIPVKFKY